MAGTTCSFPVPIPAIRRSHPNIVVGAATGFRVHHRLADVYRLGRELLAGDAAHVHSPAGGQGMNAGILDAVTLDDALKQALTGNDSALDAYGAVRRPIAQQIVALADRLTRMAVVRPRWRVLRNVLLS